MNRRHFLKALAAATAAVSLAPRLHIATTIEEAARPYWPGADLAIASSEAIVTVTRTVYGSSGTEPLMALSAEQRMYWSDAFLKRILATNPLERYVGTRIIEMARGPMPLQWRQWADVPTGSASSG